MTTIYLCGPMEGCTLEEARGWRERTKALLPGYEFRDPMRADYRGPDNHSRDLDDEACGELVEGNLSDIDSSDVVLCWHPRSSTGTDMEVMYAAIRGQQVVVTIVPPGAFRHPWLRYLSDAIVETVDEAAAWMKERHPVAGVD